MSSPESVLAQIDELISLAEDATGQSFDNLTDAVAELCEGYGTGSGDVGEEPCGHGSTTLQYVSVGNGQHTVKTVCSVCGEVISEAAEACTDETGDGLCDLCGAVVDTGGEEVCSHVNTTEETISNGNGNHTVKVTCTDCGTVISGTSVKCSPGVGNPTITSNGDGTHTSVTKCGVCEGIISEVIEPCEDTDGDGLCDVCGAAVGSDDYAGEDYTETLNGVRSAIFMVSSSGALVCASDTATGSNVAVGKFINASYGISGKAVTVIPIPEKATKITITFGDNVATRAEILVIQGSVDNVTQSDTSGLSELNEQSQVSLNIVAGTFDYVVFNAYGGSYSQTNASAAGTASTVRFD